MVAGIYIRKSREEKDKPSHRLTVQREQLPAFAKNQGWQFEVYDDGHASAAKGKFEDLKERSRLENDIRANKIQVILCIELSRLSRDDSLQDYTAWLALCSEFGVKLATPSRSLDPSQPSDWMLLLIEGGFSSVEMKVLQARMRDGRQQAFREGKWLGGTPPAPFIYDRNQRCLIVDNDKLLHVRRLWELAESKSAKATAEELNMSEISVRRAISDERLLIYQALRQDTETGEMVHCDWQSVMDKDQAERIRSSRKTRKNSNAPRPYAALLSNLGILECGYCGRTVKVWNNSRIRKDGSRNNYYGCQTKNDKNRCHRARLVPQHYLEDKVLTNFFSTLKELDKLKEYWLQEQTMKASEDIEPLENMELAENEKKQRLVAAIASGVIDFVDAKSEMDKISIRLSEIRHKRSTVNIVKEPPNWDDLEFSRDDYNLLSTDEKRMLLSASIFKIYVYENNAIIEYKFPRLPNGERTSRVKFGTSNSRKRFANCTKSNS